jgi:hypothetical protein
LNRAEVPELVSTFFSAFGHLGRKRTIIREQVLQIGFASVEKPGVRCALGLSSPSRHIYNPLTTAVAFRCLSQFDRVGKRRIKVDGTFA